MKEVDYYTSQTQKEKEVTGQYQTGMNKRD
jgi:hypothetical protein